MNPDDIDGMYAERVRERLAANETPIDSDTFAAANGFDVHAYLAERKARIPGLDTATLLDVVDPFWTADHTANRLNITPDELDRQRATGGLLGVTPSDSDRVFYPVFQFEKRTGKVQVKPALRVFMATLRDHDPWTIAVLINTPAPELDGLTPLGWAEANRDTATLIAYAAVVLPNK